MKVWEGITATPAKLKPLCNSPISEVNLSDNIGKVEQFTDEELEEVEVMVVHVDSEVVDEHALALSLGFVIDYG